MQAAQYTHLSALVFALAHRSIGPWIAACCKQRLGIANRLRCLWDRLEAGNVPLLCFYYANRLPAGTRLVLLLDPNDAARQVLAVALRWLRPNSSFIVSIILLAGSTARCRHGARWLPHDSRVDNTLQHDSQNNNNSESTGAARPGGRTRKVRR